MKLLSNIPQLTKRYSWRYYVNDEALLYKDCDRNEGIVLKHNSKYVPLGSINTVTMGKFSQKTITSKLKNNYRIINYAFSKSNIPDNPKIEDKIIEKSLRKFIFQEPIIPRKYSYESFRTFHKAAFYKAILSFNGDKYVKLESLKPEVIVQKGLVYTIDRCAYVYNHCLDTEKYINAAYAPEVYKYNILAGFMIERSEYYKSRLTMFRNGKLIDVEDYSKIKFFIDPKILEKDNSLIKVGNFIKKYVYPVIEKAGIEIIKESPEKYFDNQLGKGYGLDKTRDFIDKNPEIIRSLLPDNKYFPEILKSHKLQLSDYEV